MSRFLKRKSQAAEKKPSESFDEEIKQKNRAFVLFYATWCPFSRRFLPVFEEFAKNNPQECMSVVIDDKPNLCEEYSIEYYPTVLMFKSGVVHKRLDAEPGVGLNKQQLSELTQTS
jgi:thiol-disulfide isomerase/thioredoxin